MSRRSAATGWVRANAASRAGAYVELAKLRVVVMIVATTFVGFHLGASATVDPLLLFHALASTGLVASGALVLNQYLERDLDRLMVRTRTRPIPSSRLTPEEAVHFGSALVGLGLLDQCLAVGPLAAGVTATTALAYLLVYTPLKRRTPLCTVVGAVSGALPPVTGWVAARGELGIEAWVLFGILFLWQIPHSVAIARLYRDDYERAGIRVVPVVDPGGVSSGQQVVLNSSALLAVALLPTLLGLTGVVYFFCALGLGLSLLASAVRLACSRSLPDARRLLYASLVYLPLLLGVMALDKA